MEDAKELIARELAEEIRTNTKLRHRLGMEEGDDSGVVGGEEVSVGISTSHGEFFLAVQDA